jgi:hypothetical protein
MNTLFSNEIKVTAAKTNQINVNCSVPFLKETDRRAQSLLIDIPDEFYYNPSTRTLHADNFSGGIPSLIEGEAIQLTTSNNSTKLDVNFSKNTEVITSILDNDTFLISNTSNNLKTITGANFKSDIRLSAGDNLEYGTGANINKLSLKTALTNTSLNTGTSWNGNLIGSAKLSDGSVSDTEFQRLNSLTSAILETSDKNQNNGVCGLDANGLISNAQLPSSVNDIIEILNFASLPSTGESSKIYVTLDNHKAYRWGGSSYVEISASLVLGSTTGTAYDGALGTANTDNIALKQNILVDSATSAILIDGSNNIDIDLTRTNVETSFDDNELMLIQKTNGNLCRLTKQQLKSSINTNTEYNNGTNITIASNKNINLNSDISTNSAILRTDLVLKVASGSSNNTDYLNNIIFENTASFKTIALTRRWTTGDTSNSANFCIQNGTGGTITDSSHPIRICVRSTGEVNIGSSQTKTHGFNVEGTSNFENIITGTSINITGNYQVNGVSIPTVNELALKANIASPIFTGTVGGITKSMVGLSDVQNIDVTNLAGNNLFFSSNTLNLNTDLTNMDSISASGDLDLKANDDIILLSNNDGTNSGDFVFRTNRGSGILEIMRLNGSTANLGIDISPHATYKLNVGGNVNIPSGSNYKIAGVNLPTSNTEYLLGNNLSFDTSTNPNTINMNNYLTSINSIKSQASSDLTLVAGDSTQSGDKIILKTNDIERASINNLELDLAVNLNIADDKAFMLDNQDIFSDLSTTSAKNFRLNCRIIQNLSASISDGLFINYLNNSNDNQNAHLRFYSGGSSTIRMFIENDGKIGINNVNPTEMLDVDGNINISDTNDYKINGTPIIHSYINGTNITIGSDKSINLNSPLVGISGIQNIGDTVFTRNSVQICKIGVDGVEMLNSKKFIGDIEGPIKPYIIQDTNDYDQPLVSYRAVSSVVTQTPPAQLQLILPASSKLITINHSTGLLKTKSIYVDGSITNCDSITATQFVGTLSGNATTVTNGVYLDETSTQTINGNVGVKQLNIDGTQCIYQQGTNGTDTRANLRVISNSSTSNQDGMLINYGSTGGTGADCKIYANGTTERMIIKADTGNVGIGTSTPLETLDVDGNIYAGNNSYFLSSSGSTGGSQFFGKKYGTNSILGGMEIENTTLGGNYSQKVHFKTHYAGISNGRRMSIDERGYVGISAGTPYSMLNIRDTGVNPVVERAILLGYDNNSNFTTTGLNVGNHDTRPFIWCGGNANADVTALTFTFGFGWVYNTSGNLQLLRRQSGTTSYPVMTYARSDGCVTFSNTSCASDDRLKFNETKIENALDTVMKLSPELYDKMVPPINENDDKDEPHGSEEIMEFDIENSHKESGFIAQEVEEIPELKFLVRTDNDGFKLKSINYTGIIPYNTKAIQELKLQNDELKKTNKNLIDKMYELEMKMNLVMTQLNL